MKEYNPKILSFIILVVWGSLQSFSQTLLDSLFMELANVKNDTCRVDILNKITREYRIDDPEKAFKYNKSALDLANELNYIPGIARAYSLLGTIHRYRRSDLLALNYYIKSLEFYKQLGDSLKIADIYNYMGQISSDNGDVDKSLSYSKKALSIFQDAGNYNGVAIMLNNIGVIHEGRQEDSLALHYYGQAFEINRKINRKPGMGFCYLNIGNINLRNNSFIKAKECYFQSLVYFLEVNDKQALANSYYNIGNVYVYLEQFDSAKFYLMKSNDIVNKYSFLGIKAKIALTLSDMNIMQGKHEAAINNLLEYIEIQDSLFNERINSKVLEIEKKFEFEEDLKEQEFELMEKTRKLKINKLQESLLIIILLSISVIGWFLINRKKIKIKHINEKLTAKNNELISLAMYILQKNDLINTFRNQLLQLQKRLKIEDNIRIVDEIINSLIFKIAISKDIEEFRDQLRAISKEFYNKLEQKYPGLSEKEKQLATLLRLNLTSKQMSVILDITSDSVDINRHRLRKKIGLSRDSNLIEFFNQI